WHHQGWARAAAFNLITLSMLAKTPLMPDLTGHVVMVEEVSEQLYAIDRVFFALAGSLPRVAGLRLGALTDIPENDIPFGSTEEEIAKFWCARAGIPYLGRAEIGHTPANRVVPFGLAGPAGAG
ncbi:MAG: LD-carboxypeptidase, partial [Pseudomonadota bacterium]